jgi:hypothetical protein
MPYPHPHAGTHRTFCYEAFGLRNFTICWLNNFSFWRMMSPVKPVIPAADPQVRKIAEDYVLSGSNKRAVAAVKLMLGKGFVTTDDLNELGYNHPPRAIGDVRDAGIPVITGSMISERSGRRMAIYWLGAAADIIGGRIGGRSAFPKAFKAALVAKYGSRDCITGAVLPAAVLQIDHRVPFRVAGDAGLKDHDAHAYMLLDASSQRAKSWS